MADLLSANERWRRRRACGDKARYSDWRAANAERKRLDAADPYRDIDGRHLYLCDYCDGWHIGHKHPRVPRKPR